MLYVLCSHPSSVSVPASHYCHYCHCHYSHSHLTVQVTLPSQPHHPEPLLHAKKTPRNPETRQNPQGKHKTEPLHAQFAHSLRTVILLTCNLPPHPLPPFLHSSIFISHRSFPRPVIHSPKRNATSTSTSTTTSPSPPHLSNQPPIQPRPSPNPQSAPHYRPSLLNPSQLSVLPSSLFPPNSSPSTLYFTIVHRISIFIP